ncbi:MAG: hypothetical protein ACREX3_22115 [Gammaproteobacteria bacterium]
MRDSNMRAILGSEVDANLGDGRVSSWLDRFSQAGDDGLTCQRWLRNSPAKRCIYEAMYGDLIEGAGRRCVLDVGGGLTALTRELARRHDYTLVDVLAHDSPRSAAQMAQAAARDFLVSADWFRYIPAAAFDLVIANDLFPNVDQRLELFLERFLPVAVRIRLSLTVYDEPRHYLARRIDAEEILCMLAWNGADTRRVMERYLDRIVAPDLTVFERRGASAFPNGRQVVLAELAGSAAELPSARG